MIVEKIHLKDRFPFLGENECDPTLEIYLPKIITEVEREDKKRPCVLIVPGGGYRFISGRESEPQALHLLPKGYNVFVLTYSVAPHCFPTQLRQVAAAMELIHESAQAWHCDTRKIAIMGFSAGGHLAAHYTNRYDCPQIREVFPDSKPPAALLLGYPVITADPAYSHKGSFEKLAGGTYPQTKQEQEFYSCECMVTQRTPPTFLWHCTGDKTVPVQNSLLYANALAAHGVPFQMHIYPYGRHGWGIADLLADPADNKEDVVQIQQWLESVHHWLQQTLNK